ncbi:cytochrome b [Rhizobium leguminosarum]|uniref:cytochrome b n=1 Tax=Rhizobium leguminosarum TaxID=384 RepID=UPI00048FBCA1|nr:cytochrome b/b6 domain-containing protein [Rhizobium leguminosarum]
MLKSRPDRYGAIAVSIHWLSAVLILALLGSGFRAANAMDAATKAGLLRFHIPVAIVVLLLTALRIVWWWRFDRKPAPVQASPRWQERLAGLVHVAFYIFILGMVASGIGMMILSGAAPAVFGAARATLPDFIAYPLRGPHGFDAFLLVGLLVFHAGAALYHQFVRGDHLLRRMWYGG